MSSFLSDTSLEEDYLKLKYPRADHFNRYFNKFSINSVLEEEAGASSKRNNEVCPTSENICYT